MEVVLIRLFTLIRLFILIIIFSCMFVFVGLKYNYLLNHTKNKQTKNHMLNTLLGHIIYRLSFKRNNLIGCMVNTTHYWYTIGCFHYNMNILLHQDSNRWLHHIQHMLSNLHNQDSFKCCKSNMFHCSWTCSNSHHRARTKMSWYKSTYFQFLGNYSR